MTRKVQMDFSFLRVICVSARGLLQIYRLLIVIEGIGMAYLGFSRLAPK